MSGELEKKKRNAVAWQAHWDLVSQKERNGYKLTKKDANTVRAAQDARQWFLELLLKERPDLSHVGLSTLYTMDLSK